MVQSLTITLRLPAMNMEKMLVSHSLVKLQVECRYQDLYEDPKMELSIFIGETSKNFHLYGEFVPYSTSIQIFHPSPGESFLILDAKLTVSGTSISHTNLNVYGHEEVFP